jgi:hypothetical protein
MLVRCGRYAFFNVKNETENNMAPITERTNALLEKYRPHKLHADHCHYNVIIPGIAMRLRYRTWKQSPVLFVEPHWPSSPRTTHRKAHRNRVRDFPKDIHYGHKREFSGRSERSVIKRQDGKKRDRKRVNSMYGLQFTPLCVCAVDQNPHNRVINSVP